MLDKEKSGSFYSEENLTNGFMILYDCSIKLFKDTRIHHEIPKTVTKIYCLGYPTLSPDPKVLKLVEEALGIPVESWPFRLEHSEHQSVIKQISDRAKDGSFEYDEMLQSTIDWITAKLNDRVYYRMMPMAIIEKLITIGLERGLGSCLVLPYIAKEYNLVERSGMLGLDAPGHQIVPTIERIRDRFSITITQLWPGMEKKEKIIIPISKALMALARVGILFSRSIRDAFSFHPMKHVFSNSCKPNIGYIVQGVSQWDSLKTLIAKSHSKFNCHIYVQDILKNPTAYRTLKKQGQPFTSINALLSPYLTIKILLKSLFTMWRIEKYLRKTIGYNRKLREKKLLLQGDLQALPELALYAEQLRCTIMRDKLKLVISANIIDSMLSVTTQICNEFRIPHICIQNASYEKIPLPVLADANLYFTESRNLADYLIASGGHGQIHAVGLPYYDELIEFSQKSQAKVSKENNQDSKIVIGVLTQTELINFSPLIEKLLLFAKERTNIEILIKLHPRESQNAYGKFVLELKQLGIGECVQHIPVAEFINKCDIVVSSSSTALLWAIIIGRRTFSWLEKRWSFLAEELDYLNPDITLSFEDPASVISAIEATIDGKEEGISWHDKRKLFMDYYLTGADGHACERILMIIEKALRTPHRGSSINGRMFS